MDNNQLALYIFTFGILLSGGAYLYKIRNKFIAPRTQEDKKTTIKPPIVPVQETTPQELPKPPEVVQQQIPAPQNRPVIHQVLLKQNSEIDINLGVTSGVLFGFGFALGATVFFLLLSIFLGSVILSSIATNIKQEFAPTYNKETPSLFDARR